MSEENNQNNPFDLNGRNPEAQPFNKQSPIDSSARNIARAEKVAILKQVNKLSQGEWLLTQEILQEIEANLLVLNPDAKKPTLNKSIELLKAEIENRYKDEPELKSLLIDAVPVPARIGAWRKLEGWDEAVWSRIRTTKMFNNENRYKVMDSMLKKAVDGDVQAAKIWLTLSGDYADKMDLNTDKRLDAYREINNILHNKKKE
jgi:ABC-type antimicrobial peptide transport system ATPase subunit